MSNQHGKQKHRKEKCVCGGNRFAWKIKNKIFRCRKCNVLAEVKIPVVEPVEPTLDATAAPVIETAVEQAIPANSEVVADPVAN